MRLKRYRLTLLVFFVLTVAFVLITYKFLDQSSEKMVVSYIQELADHDMKTVRDFVSGRWKIMEGIYFELGERDLSTCDDLAAEIKAYTASGNIDHLYLMDSSGRIYYNSEFERENADNIVKVFHENHANKRFVLRYDDENQNEFMFYGFNFYDSPIVLADGTRIIHMVLLNDISKIRESLSISSFDGRGYSSVIDSSGRYIVTESSLSGLDSFRSFFELLEKSRVREAASDGLIRDIVNRQRVEFWCRNPLDELKYIIVQPIEGSDWSFITSVEASVFTDQVSQFIQIILFLLIVLFVILCIVFITFYSSRKKLKNFYSGIVAGVYNRQYYNDVLVKSNVNALAIMDLDHLKDINDTYGHPAGDQAIVEMAEALVRNVKSTGEIFRFGGDEFGVAFREEITPDAFLRIMNNICEDIRNTRLINYPDVRLTLSIGGYYGGGVLEDLLKPADDLLYEAKRTRDAAVTNIDRLGKH